LINATTSERRKRWELEEGLYGFSNEAMTVCAIHLLQCHLIQFEQDLEGSGQTCCLNLAPEATFVAANAVHNSSDVPEVRLELFFEHLSSEDIR
jgi:hypothetical protein